jgi:hypothetical protein
VIDEARLRYLFPKGSQDFFAVNRLRPAQPQQTSRSALVDSLPGKAENHGRIILRYRIFRVRFLDQDNLNGSTKPVTDCLVQVGLIPSDDSQTIEVAVTQERVRHYGEERTEIEICY